MDIEFGANVIALRVRRVDNTKMVAEFLFVKIARISLNNLGFYLELKPDKVKLPMLYFKEAMFLQFYLRDLGQVWYFNLLHQTMLVVCPLQSIFIDYLIAEARRMGMPAASIADISDGESRSAKFKLLFGVWLSR